MRRLLGAVAVAFLFSTGLVTPPAAAQETAVTLRLVSQSPVVLGYHRGTLDLKLLAFNGGATTLKNLRLVVSFGPRIATQGGYEESILSTDAASTIAGSAIATDEKDLHFEIEPGTPGEIDMRVDITSMSGIDQADSQVYPTAVQLWSEFTVVASLVTPTIYLVAPDPPVRPLLSTTWVQLSAPVAFGADGTLIDAGFPATIAEGGPLRAPLDSVATTTGGRHPDGVFDLAVDPLLIAQARDVSDGYRLSDGTVVTEDQSVAEAAKYLRILDRVTVNTDTLETIAQPYGDPIVPAMLASGLSPQLAAAREAGRIVVDNLDPSSIGSQRAAGDVVRPRDGRLSDVSLDWLANVNAGSTIVLGNDDTVDRSPFTQGIYAPSPIVPTDSGATMVLPDPTTQALFDRTDLFTDPERGAQIILGELAVIWKQAPAPAKPTKRGVALAPPSTLPPDVWSPLLSRLSDAPFLTPVTASRLVQKVNVDELGYSNEEAPLVAPDDSSFGPDYATQIADLSRSVEALNSMLPEGDPRPADLRRRLFTATAPNYQLDPLAGQPWLDSVASATEQAFAAATPTAGSDSFTFTSREGTIGLQFGDPGPAPLTVSVELVSDSVTITSDNPVQVVLDPGGGFIQEFDAVVQGSGLSQVTVVVRAPDGQTIGTTPIEVRSTAVNRIAFLVTAGAAVGLVALYARRWSRRRRNATT